MPIQSHSNQNEYRTNVAIVICNNRSQVLWARRVRHDGWQFPQGGVDENEYVLDAAYRELEEELGLQPNHVRLVMATMDWLTYDIPSRFVRINSKRRLKGQKQKWYLFEFTGDESDFCLDCCDNPEFDDWKWVNYWAPIDRVVSFKRDVYRRALLEFAPFVDQIHKESHYSRRSVN